MSEEILTCNICEARISPPTIGAYLQHLETAHPEERRAIGVLKRLLTIGARARERVKMKCPWECGWEGPPEKYVEHLETCPKYKKGEPMPSKWVPVSPEVAEKLARVPRFLAKEFPKEVVLYLLLIIDTKVISKQEILKLQEEIEALARKDRKYGIEVEWGRAGK